MDGRTTLLPLLRPEDVHVGKRIKHGFRVIKPYLGRLILAVGILMGAGLVWTERPQESFLVSIAVVIALMVTAYGFYIVHLRRRRTGRRSC